MSHRYYKHVAVLGNFQFGSIAEANRASDKTPIMLCNICTRTLRQVEKDTFTRSVNAFLGQHHYNLLKYTCLMWQGDDQQAYLEAEPWAGETLAKFIQDTRKARCGLPEHDIWLILAQVISGIHFLCSTHSSEEVFVLLAPGAIIITPDCRLKLCIYGEWIRYIHDLYTEKTTGQALTLLQLQHLITHLTGNHIDTYSEVLKDFYADCERQATSLRIKTLSFIRLPEIQQALAVARGRAGIAINLPPKPTVHSSHVSGGADIGADTNTNHVVSDTTLDGDSSDNFSVESTSSDFPSHCNEADYPCSEHSEASSVASRCLRVYASQSINMGFTALEAGICAGEIEIVKSNIWVLFHSSLMTDTFHLALTVKNGDVIATIIEFAEEHNLKLRLPVQQGKLTETATELMTSVQVPGFKVQNKHKQDLGKLHGGPSGAYCTALMMATFYGCDDMLVQLLGELGIYDYHGLTALQYGCLNASWSRLRYLVPEMKMSRVTWLMIYAALGQAENVREHIEDLFKQTYYGYTALMFAACNNHPDCVMLLLQESGSMTQNGRTALIWAARKGSTACVKALYSLEKDLFTTDGSTALMAATEGRYLDCVEVLLAQAGMRNMDGYTALMRAAQMGSVEILKLLVEKEAGYQNKNGWSALMFAAYENRPECVELLVDKEHGLTKPGKHTALMLAAKSGNYECVKILLPHEGGMQDENGYTALMYAAEDCSVECVSLLAAREFCIKDNFKRTALMRVRKCMNDACFKRKDDARKCLDILTELLKPRSMLPNQLTA